MSSPKQQAALSDSYYSFPQWLWECHFYLIGSGAYNDGVNFEQVHEELQKEMQVAPPGATANAQANNLPPAFRRDDVMYFSIWAKNPHAKNFPAKFPVFVIK